MESMTCTEWYPKIYIYQKAFKDISNTLKIFKDSEDNLEGSGISGWVDWYIFGKTIERFNFGGIDNENKKIIIVDPNALTERQKAEKEVLQEIYDIFYAVTEDYCLKNNIKIKENWEISGPSVSKYLDGHGITDELAMHYHTDYQIEKEGEPGNKFAITATMYLNDDYDDGGVDFLIGNDLMYYKPKAGDIMVFPSGNPKILSENNLYCHGVKKTLNGEKYFIRMNWIYWENGSEEWHEGLNKYGEARWTEMNDERKKIERAQGLYHMEPSKDAVRIK
jgi:hypothetical protein